MGKPMEQSTYELLLLLDKLHEVLLEVLLIISMGQLSGPIR